MASRGRRAEPRVYAPGITFSTAAMKTWVHFAAPLGILGRMAKTLVLRRYITRFLKRRNAVIKRMGESEERRKFLPLELA